MTIGLYLTIAALIFFLLCFAAGRADDDDPEVFIGAFFAALLWGLVIPAVLFIGGAYMLGRATRR